MPRAKRGFKRRKRVKKILDRAEGFHSRRKNTIRRGAEAVDRAFRYAWVHRRMKKRDFRTLWISRIAAATGANEMSYSRFIAAMNVCKLGLNRKMLSEIAIREPGAFTAIINEVRKHAPAH